MNGVAEHYTRTIRSELGYSAIWLPDTKIDIGSIGNVTNGIFVPIGDTVTGMLNIHVEAEPHPANDSQHLLFQSQRGVSLQTKAAGETAQAFSALTTAQAGIAVEFSDTAACVISLSRYQSRRMARQPGFKRELLDKLTPDWERSFAVITEVICADSGTILVSKGAQGRVEIAANATVGSAPLVALGDLNLGLSVVYSHGNLFQLVGATKFTPLFRAIQVKETFFNGLVFGDLDEEPLDLATMTDDQITAAFDEI